MKALLFFILLPLCFCTCNNKPYPQTMQVADSLASIHPNKALTLLKQLKDSIKKEPEETQMYYQLLTIKTGENAYIPYTSDSLINQLVTYYEKKGDKKHLPETYYYAGRIYTDLGDTPQALNYLQKATKIEEKNRDNRLICLIYNQIGVLYLYQRTHEKALTAFNTASSYARLSNDSTLIVNNLRNKGRAFVGLNEADSTVSYYDKAKQIALETGNIKLANSINTEMAGVYNQWGEYQKAFIYIQTSKAPTKNSILYYTILSNLYLETGKTDSALYCYKKMIPSNNPYDNQSGYYQQKRNCYKGLSKITRQQGKLAEALDYMGQSLSYTDSLLIATNAESVKKNNALYNYQFRERENHRLEEMAQRQKNWIMTLSAIIVFVLTIILAAYIIYRLRKKQQQIQTERQQEKLKEIAEGQYRSSQQFIDENKIRIEALKEKLQNTESQKDELEKNLQEAEKELLELTNKQVATLQKMHILSETAFKESQIYKDFRHVAGLPHTEKISQKEKITKNDWEELTTSINHTYDNFTVRLQALYPDISEHELRICMLIKIAIPPMGIAKLTAHSKQAITSSRKKLYEKTHNRAGSPDLWDSFIVNF